MNNSAPSGIGGWLLVYIIWTALYIASAMFVVYKLQIPPQSFLAQLREAPGGQPIADLIYRLSWGYVIVSWAWYLLYAWVLLGLIQIRQGIVKYVKCMIICTPLFNTLLPFIAAAVVATQIPGADFWGAVQGAYGTLTVGFLITDYLYAFGWLAYFICSSRVRNTWPNG